MTSVLGTLFKTWQRVPTRDRGSSARSAVQPPALTEVVGCWGGGSPVALPQHSQGPVHTLPQLAQGHVGTALPHGDQKCHRKGKVYAGS